MARYVLKVMIFVLNDDGFRRSTSRGSSSTRGRWCVVRVREMMMFLLTNADFQLNNVDLMITIDLARDLGLLRYAHTVGPRGDCRR